MRLIQLNTAKVKPLLERFDADKTRDALKRFTDYLAQKAGKPATPSPQGEEMLKAALDAAHGPAPLVRGHAGQPLPAPPHRGGGRERAGPRAGAQGAQRPAHHPDQ